MRVSLIINTCMGDLFRGPQSNPFRSRTYAERQQIVYETVESCTDFDEIIVSGILTDDQVEELTQLGASVVQVPPISRTRADALTQREVGARYATGDILVFSHDDHRPEEGFAEKLLNFDEAWNIIVPQRVHAETGETLNNGFDEGYMGGHTLAMTREVWAAVPWDSVMTTFWDRPMTRLWQEKGFEIRWLEGLVHFDCEAKDGET